MIRQLCFMVLLVVTFSATADINGRIVRVLFPSEIAAVSGVSPLAR